MGFAREAEQAVRGQGPVEHQSQQGREEHQGQLTPAGPVERQV
jgi:hypothetical protein